MQGADPEAGGAVEAADSAGDHLQVEKGVRHEIATFKGEKKRRDVVHCTSWLHFLQRALLIVHSVVDQC